MIVLSIDTIIFSNIRNHSVSILSYVETQAKVRRMIMKAKYRTRKYEKRCMCFDKLKMWFWRTQKSIFSQTIKHIWFYNGKIYWNRFCLFPRLFKDTPIHANPWDIKKEDYLGSWGKFTTWNIDFHNVMIVT